MTTAKSSLHPYLKQSLLFFLAVLLPSSALVFLSFRILTQEWELAQKRLEERRELLGDQFGIELDRHLREIVDRVAALSTAQIRGGEWAQLHPDLVLVAPADKERFILPWETDAEDYLEPEPPEVAVLLNAGARHEFREANLPLALARYREAAILQGDSGRRAGTHLAAARVLFKMGAAAEAENLLSEVLDLPLSARDEFGVPHCFYAAEQLLRANRRNDAVFAKLTSAVPENPKPLLQSSLAPAADCMAADLFELLRGKLPEQNERIKKSLAQLGARTALQERAEQLVAELPLLRASMQTDRIGTAPAGRWTMDSAARFLVSLERLGENGALTLLAVNAEGMMNRIPSGELLKALPGPVQLVRGPDPLGVWLGERFPNLQIIIPPSTLAPPDAGPRRLYTGLIALVLGFTLFGAYLWWRDTRRELRVAALRSDFVSSVSHELKTPLTSVRMLAETLRIRDIAAPERNEYLDLILSESERLGRLLKNVLDFSQMEKGARGYQLEPVALGRVIETAVSIVQRPLEEKKLELAVSNQHSEVILQADREALEQALLNLLYNAIKYSPTGGRIELRTTYDAREVQISVRDYGLGIHPRDHERIFERFYRTPDEHNRRIPGTGLGLALVKHIVEGHRGSVTIQSAPGAGSTFSIHLPAPIQSAAMTTS